MNQAIGIFGDLAATGLRRVTRNQADLDVNGWWAVTQTFEGEFVAFEFENVFSVDQLDLTDVKSPAIDQNSWIPSMSALQYQNAVNAIKEDISKGWVYQANLCYILSTKLTDEFDPIGLWKILRKHNPAPYLSALFVPASESGLDQDISIVSASPELFLSRDGKTLLSSPIKGTGKIAADLLEKDRAENVMIVDLIRNDLSQVCVSGTVEVPDLLRTELHPGLVHLVSDVKGLLKDDCSWQEIFEAMSPPGSVSGAPKSSALEVIQRLEPTKRGIYCGAFGYVDSNIKTAKLAVGIRTFWQSQEGQEKFLNFGTGAGITWGSDPENEWLETQLKAKHLLHVASLANS